MQGIRNLKTATKLIGLIIIMAIFIAAVGGVGYFFNKKANNDMTSMYKDRLLPVKWVNQAISDSHANRANMCRLLLANDPVQEKSIIDEINKRGENVNTLLEQYKTTKMDDIELQTIATMEKYRDTYIKDRAQFMESIKRGDRETAFNEYVALLPDFDQYLSALQTLAEHNGQVAEDINTQNDKDFVFANMVLLSVPLVAIIFLTALGLLIARMITKPLSDMVNSIEKDDHGNIKINAVTVTSSDEIGQLATALNALTGQVRNFVGQVSTSAEHLASAAEELSTGAEQSAQAAEQVASSVTDMAQGADIQVNAVNDTSAVVEQISASSQQIAASTNNVADMTEKAKGTAELGKESVDKAVTQMASIGKSTTQVQGAIHKLTDSSQQISEIVDVISDIAGQTNLLALNAAIEAARAGEQGRGFAVVAEEVRKLAEQCQEAAKQIESLINENQGNIDAANTAMTTGAQDVEVGIDVVNAAGQSFEEIASLVETVATQINEIATGIDQMAEGTQTIVTSVEKIAEISTDAASQTQTVSAATEEQSASMEQIVSSSQSLSQMAQDLQVAVNKFTM